MNITGVTNYNTSFEGKTKKEKSIVKGVAIAAGTGAVFNGGFEAFMERRILKNPTFAEKALERMEYAKVLIENGTFNFTPEVGARKLAFLEKKEANLKEFLANGKYQWKTIGKLAARGAVVFSLVYLICKGVGALFHKKEKPEEA